MARDAGEGGGEWWRGSARAIVRAMLGWIALLGAATVYGGALVRARSRGLAGSPYPSPDEAEAEIEALARAHPALCALETLGSSTEERPIRALVLRGGGAGDVGGARVRPALLVTAHIHAVEYIGAYVARAVARRLAEGYGVDREVTELLDAAEIWVVPLLNPDGARRVWRRNGISGLGQARFTANGVDPNRNFPFVPLEGRGAWNSGRNRPGSAYYRGPHPLSEPECLAIARLCREKRFCAAINFHSFGGVVYMPAIEGAASADDRARRAFAVFQGLFQSHQKHVRYRPIPERSAAIVGQLDAFLFSAFGTPSVTIEVSRPGWHVLQPGKLGNVFWIANPARPERWVENDAPATVRALAALLERTEGRACEASRGELAEAVPG